MRLVFIFVLLSPAVFGQEFLPDSVRENFAGIPQDTIYVDRLNELSLEYLRTNPSVSRQISENSLLIAQEIRYVRGYARALTMMGNSYWTEGIYEFAQNYYLLAARQYRSINDSTGLGQIYNNIGEVYKKLNDYNKALEYLLQSMQLEKKDKTIRATTLYNVGELYIRLGQIEKAKTFLDQSMAIAVAEGNNRVIAFNYWSFGAIEAARKNYDGAIEFYFQAEALWKKVHDLRSLIQTYQEIAELYRLEHKYDEAEKYLDKAMELSAQIKVADLQVNNYLRVAKLDSARGNYSRAFYYLSRHNSLKDSVYNLLKVEQIARIHAIYETDARERENKQLRAEKELQRSQLQGQKLVSVAIGICLVLVGVFAWTLNRQRRKIQEQKEAIEIQATVLIKLNDELQELNKTLEARIAERTTQLTIQNQRLTEYTFVNAHKLRAPVASILGLLNLIPKVPENERTMMLTHLKTCGEQLDAIIRELSRSLESAIISDEK